MPATPSCVRGTARRDAGAVSVEWAGIVVVAALIASLVIATVASPQLAQTISGAVCRILTLGQGSCSTPDLTADRMPTEPCSVAGNGYGVSGRLGVVNFAAAGERAVLHEELSNGQHRVTVTVSSGAGVEAGAGWEARVRLEGDAFGDFSDTSWGWDMGADADALVTGQQVHTYVVNSTDEVDRIVEAALMDAAIDLTTSTQGPTRTFGEYVLKPLVNGARELLGLPTTSDATSVTYLAGASAQASAWMTPLGLSNTEGMIGGDLLLGVTTHADGTFTLHGQAASATQVRGNFVTLTDSWPPLGAVRVDATYNGTDLVSISVGSEVVEAGSREHNTWTLPIRSEADLEVASGLLSPLPDSWERFFGRVDSHGQATRVTYDTSQTTSVEVGAAGRLLSGAGVNVGGSLFNDEISTAEYFDGARWVPWDSCLG